MIAATAGKKELLTAIDETVAQLIHLFSSLNESQVNTIPYQDSWTAAQLLRHVTKSTNGMAKAMLKESKPAERDPAERIPQLKQVFLDFSSKLQSPEFIIPEDEPYTKQTAIDELNSAFERLKENVQQTELTGLVEGLPLGPITKYELLHFVLYHTQRHLQQLQKITGALKNN